MDTKTNYSTPTPPLKIEGALFVVTDYGNVCVSDETLLMFLNSHSRNGLKQATVERRARESCIAVATYLARKAWDSGESVNEI